MKILAHSCFEVKCSQIQNFRSDKVRPNYLQIKENTPTKNNFDPFLGQKYFYDPLGGIKKLKIKNHILAFLTKAPKKI